MVNDKIFIQPRIILVRKNFKSVKIALDARELNKAITEDKSSMLNLEHLIDLVAEQLDEPKDEAWFTTPDMLYAHGQSPLDRIATNFAIPKSLASKLQGRIGLLRDFQG